MGGCAAVFEYIGRVTPVRDTSVTAPFLVEFVGWGVGMQLIGVPIGGIVVNVIANCLVGTFGADDVFVVVALPETFVK